MNQKLALLLLLLTLSLSGCDDATKGADAAVDKLNATAKIAVEIQTEYSIESHPYYRGVADAAQIELNVSDPQFDHQSLANQIAKLKSVQSFDGELHLIFRGPQAGSGLPPKGVKYDAKTGQPLAP